MRHSRRAGTLNGVVTRTTALAIGLLVCGCSSASQPTSGETGGGDAGNPSPWDAAADSSSGDAARAGDARTAGDAGNTGDAGIGGGDAGSGLAPMPLISRGVPAFASSGTASLANDADYDTMWRSNETTSTSTPSWIAYDLSSVPAAQRQHVDVVFYAAGGDYSEYDIYAKSGAVTYNEPRDYTLEGNAAPGGASSAPTSGWQTLTTVTGNTLISKQHAVDLNGYSWLRLNVTAVNGSSQNYNTAVNLDVHDASKGIEDSWLFLGDSITAFAMRNDGAGIGAPSFAALVHASKKAYFPAAEGAGEGGWTSGTAFTIPSPDGNGTLFDSWIRNFPGRFVCLSYGTNDGADTNGGQATFDNFVKMIGIVTSASKVPCIPHVPWAEDAAHQTNAQVINGRIDSLYKMYPAVVKGPDLYAILQGHTEWFQDNLHPNPQGREQYRQGWANAVLGLYP
jgi:hypothetical protein